MRMKQLLAAPRRSRTRRSLLTFAAALAVSATLVSTVAADTPSTTDPRATLTPGDPATGVEAGVAALGVELLANRNKPAGWFNPANPGDFGFVNSDLAFEGDHAFVGNFNGFLIYNIADPANPTLRTAVVCPGGQGEVSVYGNLLFMSAEETRARTDCGAPSAPTGSPLRFRGLRVFDISNLDAPVQVAAVQSCRGSHTHTVLKSPSDANNVYVYINGTGGVRPASEMASCKALPQGTPQTTPQFDEGLSQWRVEVVRVPLNAPQNAAIVNGPRLMRDATTGQLNGLQNAPPTPLHPSGTGWSPSPTSDSCHDITTYPEIGLAAGACEGNGLLIDISDPANPVRIDAVTDNNYAYWHGATFSNDGKTVVFTDEWGGGTAARCRATDDLSWGADAIYDIVNGKLVFRSYYKLPVAQTVNENCVSHLPSLIPVPGRNLMTQAWYQGGLSVIDFTDSAHPREIAYYDRGPIGIPPPPDRARRPLVDLLLQRLHLRLRDRSRLRRVEADADRGAVGERDQGSKRGEDDPADAAAPAAVHLGPELRGRALASRPARAGGHDRCADAPPGGEVHQQRRGLRRARQAGPRGCEPAGAVEAPQGRPVRRAPAGCPRPRGDLRLVGAESD